jgi:hypothetical protein
METIEKIKATVVKLENKVYKDKNGRPYFWAKILLNENLKTSRALIYSSLITRGAKVIVREIPDAGFYTIADVEEYGDPLIGAIEMLIEIKVSEALAKKGV